MRLLLDINVILDVLLDREPWVAEAARLLSAIECGQARGSVAGHTVTTVYYVLSTVRPRDEAVAAILDLLGIVDVVPVTEGDFHDALSLDLADFEDAVQAVCALKIEADFIVTRDAKGYRGIPVPAEPAGVVLAAL